MFSLRNKKGNIFEISSILPLIWSSVNDFEGVSYDVRQFFF